MHGPTNVKSFWWACRLYMQGRYNYSCILVEVFLYPCRNESLVQNVIEPIHAKVSSVFLELCEMCDRLLSVQSVLPCFYKYIQLEWCSEHFAGFVTRKSVGTVHTAIEFPLNFRLVRRKNIIRKLKNADQDWQVIIFLSKLKHFETEIILKSFCSVEIKKKLDGKWPPGKFETHSGHKQGVVLQFGSWSDVTNPSTQKPWRYKTLRIVRRIRGWIQIGFFAKSFLMC
jgi:hypothetical protein